MNCSEALETLRRSEADLRARGVRWAAVFGSVARGVGRPDSDIDILVEIDLDARLTVFDYAGLKDYIGSLFDGPVDVVNRDGPMSVPPRPVTRSMPSKPIDTALRDILHHIELAQISRLGSTAPRSSRISRRCTPSRVAWRSFPKLHAACRTI